MQFQKALESLEYLWIHIYSVWVEKTKTVLNVGNTEVLIFTVIMTFTIN